MSHPIVILQERDSAFAARLARAIASGGTDCLLRSLDAPFVGGAVRVDDEHLVWEGTNLREVGAIFLERPLFPWPQPASLGTLAVPREDRARVVDRQARSLAISALMTAASSRPVVNRPESGALAASRAIALAELEAANVPVCPWSVISAPAVTHESEALFVDLIGRERWHRPSRPPAGDPCLSLGTAPGHVLALILVGGEPAGAVRYASAARWSMGEGGGPVAPEGIPKEAASTAARAAAALKLEIAEISVINGPSGPQVLLVEPGPDLDAWDTIFAGGLAARIARRLVEIAESEGGGNS